MERNPTGPGTARGGHAVAPRWGGAWRDNIEAMTMAVVMALALKSFVVEAYKIPTGSMQPTLFGDERANVFDRILVDKLAYRFEEPERFDVVVFRYPLDRSKNFVKRLVGMPGEELRIEHGDIWVRPEGADEWSIPRRSRKVQRSTWKRLAPDARPPWTARDADRWVVGTDWLRARGDGEALFRGGEAVRDAYTDGYPDPLRDKISARHGNSEQNRVGDLRLEARATAMAGCSELVVELTEGVRRYSFRIPGPAAPPDAAPTIAVRGADPTRVLEVQEVRADAAFRLPAGRAVEIGAQNLDDLLELDIDGEIVATVEIPAARSQNATIAIGQTGEGADLADVRVLRDIYYLPAANSRVRIPAEHYYMLGDNTQDSSDSREWTYVRWELEGEDGEREILRGNRETDNPRYLHTGAGGTRLIFVDEWGERRLFAWGDGRKLPYESAPFVPRDLILGRALCVFWPIRPWDDLVRLEWVR